METKRTSTILASGILILACSGKALDVGSNQNPGTVAGNGGSGGSGGAGGSAGPGPGANAVLPSWPSPGSCAAGGDLPMAGVWEGEEMPPNVRRFRVTIGGSAQTGACGSVVYGEGVPPPPATDPDARYPSAESGYPEADPNQGFGARPSMWGPMPGVSYAMVDTATEESRMHFTVGLSELWNGWCALQTPISSSIGYGCMRNGVLGGADAFKWALCYANVCACNAQECVASRDAYTYVEADLHFAGDEAWGTNGYHSVALRRIE